MKAKLLKKLRRKFRIQEIDGHYRVFTQTMMKVEYTDWDTLEITQMKQRRMILAEARGNSTRIIYV